jgi:ABC-type cobalamin transport system permease subunit
MHSKQMTRIIMISAPFAILLSVFLSVCYGAKQLEPEVIFSALLHFDPGNTDHQIIWHSRLPRAAGALLNRSGAGGVRCAYAGYHPKLFSFSVDYGRFRRISICRSPC